MTWLAVFRLLAETFRPYEPKHAVVPVAERRFASGRV